MKGEKEKREKKQVKFLAASGLREGRKKSEKVNIEYHVR